MAGESSASNPVSHLQTSSNIRMNTPTFSVKLVPISPPGYCLLSRFTPQSRLGKPCGPNHTKDEVTRPDLLVILGYSILTCWQQALTGTTSKPAKGKPLIGLNNKHTLRKPGMYWIHSFWGCLKGEIKDESSEDDWIFQDRFLGAKTILRATQYGSELDTKPNWSIHLTDSQNGFV